MNKRSNEGGQIVGGSEAQMNTWPWQAALDITSGQTEFFCGGTLISPNKIVTAAHCLQGATGVTVRLGEHNL